MNTLFCDFFYNLQYHITYRFCGSQLKYKGKAEVQVFSGYSLFPGEWDKMDSVNFFPGPRALSLAERAAPVFVRGKAWTSWQ